MGIFIKHAHVAVRRRGIQIKITFLHVFAVIALVSGKPKQPLFQNWIAAIPHRQAQANILVAVADPGDAVLSPAIGS